MEKTLQTSAELNFKMWDPAEDASQNGGVIVNGDERMTYNKQESVNENIKVLDNDSGIRLGDLRLL